MKLTKILFLLVFGVVPISAYAEASSPTGQAVTNMKVSPPREIFNPPLTQSAARSVFRTRDGKILKFSYNVHGQLIAAKRIGGASFQYAFKDASAKSPYAVKVGKYPWMSADEMPVDGSTPKLAIVELPDVSDAVGPLEVDGNRPSNVQKFPQRSAARLTAGPGEDDDEYDLGDYESDLRSLIGEVMEYVTSTGGGGGGGGNASYCQSPHCSFPTLEACLADCDSTKDWGLLTCSAFAGWNVPLATACGAAIMWGHNNVCRPRCQAGLR